MKIYTKAGDWGRTSLYGGTKLLKSDLQIEAYGTVDELNAFVGLLSDKLTLSVDKSFLVGIQSDLFVLGSHLANDGLKSKIKLPDFPKEKVSVLEQEMDAMEEKLPAMTHFVLPSGHELISTAHVVRTVCRRAERIVVALKEQKQGLGDFEVYIQYLNRLSDYFFVLSRYLAQELKIEEIKWIPEK